MADKLTDILTYVLSLVLAGGVIAFAAYKVVDLNAMENPPANMGLNFPAAKRKVIMEGPSATDPLTTQSLGAATPPLPRPDAAGAEEGGLYAYELLTVINGVAFVTVASARGQTLVPVTIGTKLPGGLTVEAISRRGGRWAMVAGNLLIEQRDQSPQ